MTLILALTLAAGLAPPAAPPQSASLTSTMPSTRPNPRAIEFIERDPGVRSWALAHHDANHDGWLTSYEAATATDAFRDLADADRDGRLTVSEYERGVTLVRASP
jgi:hypothetical protein